MSRRLLASLAALAVVLTIAAYLVLGRRESTPADVAPLRVTINSWVGWAPLYLAAAKGLNDDTKVELIRVEDTGARKSTMIAGQVDGYASSVDNFALDAAQGVPGKIVLCFDESAGADGIVSKRAVATVADLRGRRVGYQKGLPSHFLLLTVLSQAGMQESDIVHFDLDADKAGAAFAAGELDAAVTWEPWISRAAAASDGKILVNTKDLPGLIVDALVFRDEVLADRPKAVRDLITGWFRALEYWKLHEEESVRIMAAAYNLPPDEFRAIASGIRFYDLPRNRAYMGSGDSSQIYKVFQSAGVLWRSAGVIRQPVDGAAKIDASFLPR